MKYLIPLILLLTCLFVTRADDKQPEKIIDEWASAHEKLIDALKSIKDKPTAKAALPKLAELDRAFHEKETAARILLRDKPDAFKELEGKYTKRLDEAGKKHRSEYVRLDGIPDVYALLQESSTFQRMQKAFNDLAWHDTQTLARGASAFKIRFGRYPTKLEELMKPPDGNKPFLDRKEPLLDPWGRPYEYDVKGPKNDGRRPDVWSLGPRHQKDAIIGNWIRK